MSMRKLWLDEEITQVHTSDWSGSMTNMLLIADLTYAHQVKLDVFE